MSQSSGTAGETEIITVLLVDDIPETRENIKKLLAFEPDFKVIGSVGTGREALAAAKQLKPNIIIMDINMPDMDGIQATNEITKAVPTVAVIMMSVQNDPDYLRKAMLAGARNFLTKPIDTDELYNTIRTVYQRNKPLAERYANLEASQPLDLGGRKTNKDGGEGNRAGHIIVVYSPQGGAGSTTIATNLASGLMKKGIRVLLVDADTQFGDVGVFLKINSQSTLADMVAKVDDLDTEFFDSAVATHESGLKVLLGPQRPEFADEVDSRPKAVAKLIEKVAQNYDFIVVDTSHHIDDMLLSLMDLATKIILVGTPTLTGVKNVRFMLDLFDKLNYPANKTVLVLNRMEDERARQRVTIATDIIEKHLKRRVEAKIPSDEKVVLNALNRGIAVISSQRERNKSPIKELIELSNLIYSSLMNTTSEEADSTHEEQAPAKRSLRLFGRAKA